MKNKLLRLSYQAGGLLCLGYFGAATSAHAISPDSPPVSETREQARTERVIDDSKYYLGGNLGVGLLTEGGGGHPGFGGIAGIHFNRDISAGFFFSRVPRGSFNGIEANGGQVSGALNFYGLEGQYHLERIPGVQLGGKLALGTNSIDVNGANTSSTDFYFGPKLGYDYAINSFASIGVEGSILFSGADNGHSTALLLAAIKLWIS
jgi:hypothetical protein